MAVGHNKDSVLPFVVKGISDEISIKEIIMLVNDLIVNGYHKASFSLKNGDFVTDSRELAVVVNDYWFVKLTLIDFRIFRF